MVWVDQVLRYGATDGECLVKVKGDAHYMSETGMRASACVEFIAQSYGFMSIAYRVFESAPDSKPLKRAFLASISEATFASSQKMAEIRAGDELLVKLSNVRSRGPLTVFHGVVLKGEDVLCDAGMRVFSE